MFEAHDHHHRLTAAGRHRSRLVAVLAIVLAVLAAEVAGAMLSGSLALLADAGHMLTDAAGITLALAAAQLARRPPSLRRTYGWHRAEIIAAALNGLLLLAVAIYVVAEAIGRLREPAPINGLVVISVATIGMIANAAGLLLLRGGQRESLNVRGAYLEVLGDLMGSAAALAAGLIVILTGFDRADAIASLAIVALIFPRSIGLLREAGHVLLEGTPDSIDLDHVRAHILAVRGVADVHDLHVWTITSGRNVISAHIVVDDARLRDGCADHGGQGGGVLDELTGCLAHHFDVEHSTFQLEPARHRDHEPRLH
jgi:cobalt-zinc-cadmium efflux system protein